VRAPVESIALDHSVQCVLSMTHPSSLIDRSKPQDRQKSADTN
jgi:hypothetical protein